MDITNTFDSILISLGYSVIGKLKSDDILIAKVVNPNGHILYIINDSNLPYSPTNIHKLTPVSNNVLSYAFKKGSFSLMNNSNYGILFETLSEHDINITIITYDNEVKQTEMNYSLINDNKFFSPVSSDVNLSSTVTFSIVSISDLVEDPTTILFNTEKNIANFRHTHLREQLTDLSEMFEQFEKLQDMFINFNNLRETVHDLLNANIGMLNRWNYDFLRSNITNDEDLEVYKAVFSNITMRKGLAISLLRLNNKLLENMSLLKTVEENIQGANKYLESVKDNVNIPLIR